VAYLKAAVGCVLSQSSCELCAVRKLWLIFFTIIILLEIDLDIKFPVKKRIPGQLIAAIQ
jgi:hypothetical protein